MPAHKDEPGAPPGKDPPAGQSSGQGIDGPAAAILPAMDRRKHARAAAAAAAVAIGLYAGTATAQGPFTRLENITNVTIGEEGHRIEIRWHATAFELRYPDVPPATEHDYRWTGRRPALRWTCRAREASGGGSEALALRLYVPRHPLHEDVAQEGDRRYWVFALTGRARRETPVEVAAAGIDPVGATLVHDRVGAGARRPALWLRLPPRGTARTAGGKFARCSYGSTETR